MRQFVCRICCFVFFFKQKTAYEIGLGIPAEPLFRSDSAFAEVDLVHQQTQNQRYGSSHIGATAKDISNVVTDAASGVVDIFHGIDKAVADTWNNFWKDEIGRASVGKECRSRWSPYH